MRLRDIQIILTENAGKIILTPKDISNDPQNKKFTNLQSFNRALRNIKATGLFPALVNEIENFESLTLVQTDDVVIPKNKAQKITQLTSKLGNQLNVFKSAITDVLPDQQENSLSLKLPKIQTLQELSEISDSLNKIFDQLLVNDEIQGSASLQNFDTGSEWLEIVFDPYKAVGLVTAMVYSYIWLKRELIKNDELVEVARNRRISNDLYQSLADELKKQTNTQFEAMIKENAQKAGIDSNNHEYFERYKFCVTEIGKLIDRGLQFFPSSKSPNEIKSTLPDFTKSINNMLPEALKLEESPQTQTPPEETEH